MVLIQGARSYEGFQCFGFYYVRIVHSMSTCIKSDIVNKELLRQLVIEPINDLLVWLRE